MRELRKISHPAATNCWVYTRSLQLAPKSRRASKRQSVVVRIERLVASNPGKSTYSTLRRITLLIRVFLLLPGGR
jgi:hypothetical protein